MLIIVAGSRWAGKAGRAAGWHALGVEMQTKEQEKERRSEEVRSRARNLRANERRADGCQPREMFKISEQLYFCCVAVAGERRREKGGIRSE